MSRLQGSRLQASRVAADRSYPAKPVRVGIAGADPARGRVPAARLPALVQLSGFTVTAVSTTRQQSAEETAARFSIPYAFHDAASLAASDDVVAWCRGGSAASGASRPGPGGFWRAGRGAGECGQAMKIAADPAEAEFPLAAAAFPALLASPAAHTEP